jgi:1-aminocyclopropane-1-carboxylate deaminase/D-cysteine desulfhydrase-like pyridoxal-dependent ACC family enzyme
MTAGTLAVATLTGLAFVVSLLRRISASVGTAPPTPAMEKEEDAAKKCALYRHFPNLSKTLAWRSLDAADETPIHICRLPSKNDGGQRQHIFLVKREDLISPQYGGNKVRSLQHQLAVCETKREGGQDAYKHLVSVGSGGSNQVVATVVHARSLGWNSEENTVIPCWLEKDAPDLDNTLNMLSVLSFPIPSRYEWGTKIGLFERIKALHSAWVQKTCIPMMLGGNCPVAVLGQAGAILELAEQIQAGNCPDLNRIYVPIGSACTVSGLALGVVLVRTLGLPAFRDPDFKIVGCNVHDGLARLDRLINMHKNPMLSFMPLTINHTISVACQALKQVGGPDVEKEALVFVKTHVDIRADADVVGTYGAHSETTRAAAQWYDEKGEISDYKTG